MKKFIFTAVLALSIAIAFISCAKKGTCELCGKENVELKTYTLEGESGEFCSDCYNSMKEFEKNLKELADALN